MGERGVGSILSGGLCKGGRCLKVAEEGDGITWPESRRGNWRELARTGGETGNRKARRAHNECVWETVTVNPFLCMPTKQILASNIFPSVSSEYYGFLPCL